MHLAKKHLLRILMVLQNKLEHIIDVAILWYTSMAKNENARRVK